MAMSDRCKKPSSTDENSARPFSRFLCSLLLRKTMLRYTTAKTAYAPKNISEERIMPSSVSVKTQTKAAKRAGPATMGGIISRTNPRSICGIENLFFFFFIFFALPFRQKSVSLRHGTPIQYIIISYNTSIVNRDYITLFQ